MPRNLTAAAIGLTLIGALVGAGFASGQEIQQFFIRDNASWLSGIIVSVLLFLALMLFLTEISWRNRIDSYQQLLIHLSGPSVGQLFQHLFALFLWFGLIIMLAGSSTLLQVQLGMPRLLAAVATAVLVYLVGWQQVAGLARANEVLVPTLLFLVLFFFLRSFIAPASPPPPAALPPGHSWLWSAVLYVAFNSALLLVIIPPLVAAARDRQAAYQGVCLAAVGIGCLMTVISSLLARYNTVARGAEIPLLGVAAELLPEFPSLYAVLLWIALATTAFANFDGMRQYLQQTLPAAYSGYLLAALILATLASQWSFAGLVGLLYPLMGYFCFIFYLISLVRQLIRL
ncbi:MAG: hypothetical protein ACOX18_10535 [Bacillota bacterium]